MDNGKNKKKKTKKRRVKIGRLFISLLAVITLVLGAWFAIQMLMMGVLPLKLSLPILGICILLPLLFAFLYMFVFRGKITSFISAFMIVVLSISFLAGNYVLSRANSSLETVTGLTSQKTHKISLISLESSGIDDISKLKGKTIGYSSVLDPEGNEIALEDILSKVEVQTLDYDGIYSLIQSLLDGEISAIVLNEAYRGTAQDISDDFNLINTSAYVLNETRYYTEVDTTMVEPDRVNVAKEPFTVLISGNDSYGTLHEFSRSDVNMLVTVNPQTSTILITNVSRDSYVPIACGADADETCPNGEPDKLTHTGLAGVATTEKTIEQMLGVTINYNVRVNFSSFENIVDALGGIDVYVEPGCEVDTFYANGTEGVKEGWNHLNGARALGFVRERKAYMDGASQRVRNQQEAIRAMIDKLCSLSTITNFNKLIEAVDSAFETNMSADEIKSFIRYQFTSFPTWTLEGYSLRYEGGYGYCAYLVAEAYVDYIMEDSVQYANLKINEVLNGGSSLSIEDPNESQVRGSYSSEEQAEITRQGQIANGQISEDGEVY